MPKFIKLTTRQNNSYRTAYVNIEAIECVFDTEEGARITFISGDSAYIDVSESAESVMKMVENA